MRASDDEMVLDVLRDVERLLAELPPDDPVVPALRARSRDLHEQHERLQAMAAASARLIEQTNALIDGSRHLLRRRRDERPRPIDRGYEIDLLLDGGGHLSGTHDHGELVALMVDDLVDGTVATCPRCDLFLTLAIARRTGS
ncbi:MAG: hypothetical protein U0869_07825 [Chloroflexota bacterium]